MSRASRGSARFAAAAGLCLLALLAGCRLIPGANYVGNLASGNGFSGSRITQQELREALVQYASRFEATVIGTADTIAARTKDPVMQRRTLRWKLGVTPVVNQAAFLSEPEDAYVGMLTVATSMHEFLVSGGGVEAFGNEQKLAVDASSELLLAAYALGERFLNKKELDRVTQDVNTLVRQQPMQGEFVAEAVQSLVTASEASPLFDWVTAIPMSPFRALQGVDQGAQAIREFNETAMEMSRTLAAMPRLVRWNLELLTLDIGQHGNVQEGLQNLDALTRSAESISATAEALPETMRMLLEEAERTGKTLTPLSQSLERTALAVSAAGSAWGGLVAELSKPPADPSQPSRPFDIREWEQTAVQISTAATELRALLDSVGALAGSESLAGPLAELTQRVEKVEAGSRALVDLMAWRGLQLILAFFVLLFLSRRLEAWLARRAAAR